MNSTWAKRGLGCLFIIIYFVVGFTATLLLKPWIMPGPNRIEQNKLYQSIPPLDIRNLQLESALRYILDTASKPIHIELCKDYAPMRITFRTKEPMPLKKILLAIATHANIPLYYEEDIFHHGEVAFPEFRCLRSTENYDLEAEQKKYIIIRAPLFEEVMKGNTKAVRKLIEAGVDVNLRDYDKYYGNERTALMYASAYGHEDSVRLLVQAGADPDARDLGNNTAMIFAAMNHHTSIVKILVEAGADPNAHDSIAYETALHESVRGNNYIMTEILLKAGADPNITNYYGDNVLSLAKGRPDLTNLLKDSNASEAFPLPLTWFGHHLIFFFKELFYRIFAY